MVADYGNNYCVISQPSDDDDGGEGGIGVFLGLIYRYESNGLTVQPAFSIGFTSYASRSSVIQLQEKTTANTVWMTYAPVKMCHHRLHWRPLLPLAIVLSIV